VANEFIIKNGYRSQGNSEVTGSLNVTGGITASLQGTATTSSFAITSSAANIADASDVNTQFHIAFVANTGSTQLIAADRDGLYNPKFNTLTVTASFATSASYVSPSAIFPYTGSARITGSLGVTGSFSVYNQNAFANYTVLDTNTGTLRGTDTISSINWNGRQLFDSNGKRSVLWRDRIGYDANESSSIEWNARQLKDGFGTIAADWSFGRRELYDRYTTASINWDNRYAVDTNASKSLYWGTRELYNSTSTVVVNWENRIAYDGASSSSIDWGNRAASDTNESRSLYWNSRELYDANSMAVVDWGNQVMSDPTAIQSINWNKRWLYNSPGTVVVDWENQLMYDQTGRQSIDWNSRALFDAAGNTSISWGSRELYDASSNLIISYDPANTQQKTEQYSYHNYYTVNGIHGEALIQYAFDYSRLNVAGETLGFGANMDPAILKGELCSLGEDGIWNITDQTSISSSAMLGICVAPYNKSVMITEGTITVVTASGYTDIPFVEGTSFYGKPVYIRSGSLGGLTTTKPTSGYVRIVGHMYYNSTIYTDYWLMKFRPSNDWYQI
jgi:hypothetical protein